MSYSKIILNPAVRVLKNGFSFGLGEKYPEDLKNHSSFGTLFAFIDLNIYKILCDEDKKVMNIIIKLTNGEYFLMRTQNYMYDLKIINEKEVQERCSEMSEVMYAIEGDVYNPVYATLTKACRK